MIVLVINCGSSSIKYQLYDMPSKKVLAKGLCEKIGDADSSLTHKRGDEKFEIKEPMPTHKEGVALVLKTLTAPNTGVIGSVSEIKAVGHRIVHGGEKYSKAVLIDANVTKAIEECCELAPLHNPPNLIGINECKAALPGVPMAAVFDTAFHQSLPKEAYLYPLPYEMYEKYRIRRYGFHGTSHAFVTEEAAKMLGKPVDQINIITCHLGNGSSMACVRNGKSVDTTMGFTPLAGVMMGTRCGDIDPAIIPFLMSKPEYAKVADVDKLMNKKSGLLGISGVSNDLRNLQEAAAKGCERSQLAIDMFCYRVKSFVGAYMAQLGRVDAVCFMGGIGENGVAVRERILAGLENFGIVMDTAKNADMIRGKAGDVAAAGSKTRILVIPTDEEGRIASETFDLVK